MLWLDLYKWRLGAKNIVNELHMQKTEARNNQDHNPRKALSEILAEVVRPRFIIPYS